MNERPEADERALSVATSIAEGVAVDWNHALPGADGPTAAVLDELRVLEDLAHVSQGKPRSWGPFTILGELGRGSYGTVYRALDTTLNLEVALKVLRTHRPQHPADADRALNEARMLAQIDHRNVVRIFRAERRGDDVGVAMELLQGRTLEELVSQQGSFSAREAMVTAIDICCGLAAVHGARLVHGDIKAQNVMRAAGGRTVLMDFGAGYDGKTDAAGGRRFAGTPLYLAPEVFAGRPRTAVSDIYSVGVLLFYLATGSFPVDGESASDVKRKHERRTPPRRLRDVRADLPDAFIRVVERATAVPPAERYQTAGELEAALSQALGQQRFFPIQRPLVLAGASAAVAALAIVGSLWATRRDAPELRATGPGPVTADPAPVPAPAIDPEGTYRIEAAFYRDEGGRDVRLGPGARVAPGDRLSLQVTSSVPTHLYVVNEDDRGESFLLFPLPGLRTANPLPANTRHAIPGRANNERVYWTVSSAGGREHFLVFASPQPVSPVFQRLFDALPLPSADIAIAPRPMSPDMVGALRGVGGLTKAPSAPSGPPLQAEFGVPLPAGEETTRGVWIRQLTLINPGR
jgi:hypothetical protein